MFASRALRAQRGSESLSVSISVKRGTCGNVCFAVLALCDLLPLHCRLPRSGIHDDVLHWLHTERTVLGTSAPQPLGELLSARRAVAQMCSEMTADAG